MSEILQIIVEEIADELVGQVKKIESRPQTTRFHYGDYLNIILRLGGDKSTKKLIALSLIEAGANKQGVSDAFRAAT